MCFSLWQVNKCFADCLDVTHMHMDSSFKQCVCVTFLHGKVKKIYNFNSKLLSEEQYHFYFFVLASSLYDFANISGKVHD